jgi:hypothetical protein
MPGDEHEDDESATDAEASMAELAAALQLDLEDDEFDDLALGDEEGDEEAAAVSGDALELDDLDVMELDAVHIEAEDDEEEEDAYEDAPQLYLELDGRFTTVDKDRFVIGRVATMCDLAIRDVNVSRQHCAIERRDDEYYAVDLGSINGILVDGRRVDNYCIAEGDELVLSGHRISASFVAPLLTEPRAEVQEDPILTGEFPPVPAAEPEPEPLAQHEAEPEPSPPAIQASTSFEERIEQRLEYISQQLVYLQQSMHALFARVDQLQGVAGLAEMIQRRLAAQRRDR